MPVAFAAIAIGAAAALGGGSNRRFWDLPTAAALGLAAGHLLLAAGFPHGHDLTAHLWGSWAFLQEVRGGDLFPRWLHRIGLGMPLPQFYGPVNFYLFLPFGLVGLAPYDAFKGVFILHGVLAAVAMYAVVRRWTGDRRAALVAAAAYAFAPYRLLDANYRTALGESAAFVVLPPLFAATLAAVAQGGRRRFAVAALAAGLLLAVHPLTLVMAAPALALWVSVEAAFGGSDWGGWREWLRRLAAVAGVFALGIALAGFFFLPLAAEKRYTSLDLMVEVFGAPRMAGHGLRPEQLFERRLWTDLQASAPAGSPRDARESEMPFYVGLGMLSLLPLAAGLGRLPGERQRSAAMAATVAVVAAGPGPASPDGREARHAVGLPLAVLALASLALTLGPAARLMARLPVLPILQFSWRFLAIASFALAAAAGFAVARLLAAWGDRRWAALLPGLAIALVVADGFPYTGAADWVPPYRGLPHFFRLKADCGRRWGCWEWRPLPPPYPLRVNGSLLPPVGGGIDVSHFQPGYPEYTNPVTRGILVDRQRFDPALWGIGLIAGPRTPRSARPEALAYARWLPRKGLGAWEAGGQARPFRRGGGRIEVDLDGRPGTVVVLEQWFPGWQVATPAGWQEATYTRQGLLRARVIAGQRVLRFRFSGWRWDRVGGWVVSGLTAVALFAPWRRKRGKKEVGEDVGEKSENPADESSPPARSAGWAPPGTGAGL